MTSVCHDNDVFQSISYSGGTGDSPLRKPLMELGSDNDDDRFDMKPLLPNTLKKTLLASSLRR